MLAARARGVSRARAVLRHAFRNSLIPIVTIVGLQFGAVLTGAVITETIFAWPGRRPAADSVDQLPRLPAGAGLHPAHRGHLRGREPGHRPALRRARSADPVSSDDAARRRGHRRPLRRSPALLGPLLVAVRSVRRRSWRCGWTGRRSRIRSASTSSGATSSRACSPARASRCSSASIVVSVSATVGIAPRRGRRLLRRRASTTLISRVIDVLLAFPGILLAIALVAVLGPSLAERRPRAVGHRVGRLRAARARAGAARARVRVRAGGARARRATPRILLRHVMPTALPAVMVQATLGMAGAISPKRRSASSASACSRRRRAGGRCSTAGARTCSTRRT